MSLHRRLTRTQGVPVTQELPRGLGALCILKFEKTALRLRKFLQGHAESSSVQSCPTLSDSMDCSKPGFPVHHQHPGLTQTHVDRVSDAIQPSHPLSSPSPSALNLSQHRVFSNELALRIRWPKCWSFSVNISPSSEHSRQISFRIDWFESPAVQGTLKILLQHKS